MFSSKNEHILISKYMVKHNVLDAIDDQQNNYIQLIKLVDGASKQHTTKLNFMKHQSIQELI